MHQNKFDPLAIALATSDAYSFNMFTSWVACARLLAKRGFSQAEAVGILYSKHMRWTCDNRRDNRKATSADLGRYLDNCKIVPASL